MYFSWISTFCYLFICSVVIFFSLFVFYFIAKKNNVSVECSLQWTDSYHENTLCFTNNIAQRDGGSHLAGFRGALTRSVVSYINSKSKNNVNVTGDDAREGLTCVISIKLPDEASNTLKVTRSPASQ